MHASVTSFLAAVAALVASARPPSHEPSHEPSLEPTQAPSRAPAQATWKHVIAPVELAYPRDHGAHPEYRSEWWYATGEVAAADGARFGVQLTIFRQGLVAGAPLPGESPLRARQAFAGHLVIVDLGAGTTTHAERSRRAVPGLAEASTTALDVRLDGWSMRLDERGALRLDAADRATGMRIALELAPEKPLVLHGDGGVSAKGGASGNASVYASWTRMRARGTLAIAGRERTVDGAAWFDHEYGTSALGAEVVGWDWFGLRLDDGRELMLFRLRRADGSADPESGGTLIAKDGSTRKLALSRSSLETRATWTSPRTKAVYPASFRLACPEEGLDLVVTTRAQDCELDTRASTGVVYWEGPVAVTGSVTGSGYAELTGYAGSIAKRF
ncbi:MAG: carotenoid 1,2-hydratase [Planctomycetes bacterium]|nr:carotenoid 1,2-hydratase [Planctomycetota bacterium]